MSTSKLESAILEKEREILKEEKVIELEAEKIFSLSAYMRKLLRKDIQQEEKEERIVEEQTTFMQKLVINKMKKHRILFPLVVVTAVVLVWRGLWGIFDGTPIISSSYVSLIAGIVLLWLFNKFTEL
jgi:hypothetical protein